MANVKYEIPENTLSATCRGCRRTIYWVKTKAGKNMPVDPDGVPHWGTCPNAKDFKK